MNVPAHTDALFRQAERGVLPLGELFQGAQTLVELGLQQEAIRLYESWIAHTASPAAYAACFNLAVARGNVGDDAGAARDYLKAIELAPGFVEARLNLGTLYERMNRPDDALAAWQGILADIPDLAAKPALHVQALNNLGRLCEIRKRLPEALDYLTRSLELDPDQPKVITHWVHLRQKLCVWPIYAAFAGVTVEEQRRHTSALAMLGASPDPAEQLAASLNFVERKVHAAPEQLAPAGGYAHKRIRIGYLSSDLCSHAVSILTAELYELHDRSRVEVYAFSWSREDNSPLRARVVGAMDHYIRIDRMTDEEAARCIRSHEIDILVDLHGLTLGARADILGWRPAPVQLTWLGFPGPTAVPGIDYVVADDFVFPFALEPHFTERPLRMPHTFQINDRRRAIGPTSTRAANGLPDGAFVFCSFNSNFKITPEVFDSWMRILKQVPDSVLWMVADSDATRANLVREAEARGVQGSRLLFAGRVAPADYLARFRLADLFLDTNPFNGGTTASDALWAGLPVLTWAGQTFCSRMAGSLLRAVGLPELVTHALEDYEALAIALGNDRPRMDALRARLAANRDASPLFDTPRFVRDYEDLLATVVRRPAGVEPVDEPTVARMQEVPPPAQLTLQQESMLSLLRPGMHSIVEVGGATLAQGWRSRAPLSHYTAVGAPAGWSTAAIERDAEQLTDADWQQLAAAQCWLFPETLERLRDPWAFLARLRRQALGPVELVACVNNGQHWLGQALRAAGNMPDRRNLHLFTRASLAALLAENGFTLVAMTTVNAQQPPQVVLDAIRALAAASGADPELAVQDALPYQYLVRAIAA
ncbi:tetratricopeptide repeat protein [Telluria mixta]|uniref:protein O-GlcNAc transferase n=1 Tax=Telluria mixta TaxID=34071 RepID=A0ABT2BVQ1_9BURK|nr:tetratricopeptide repeat protein [Telluria mixta]MCS0628711.1 tetratricopeptide repeat protein [Telluria mixta]WEM97167.1 tetratricopeptide repeat protein [Telluria mixta]